MTSFTVDDLLRPASFDEETIIDSTPFADVASLVRATSTSLRRTADRIGATVLAWTPEVALAMITAPLFEDAFLEAANALVVWSGDGGHVSTSVLTVGADVEIVLLATALSPREQFHLPERTLAILESRGGNAAAEPDAGISTRVTLVVPGVQI